MLNYIKCYFDMTYEQNYDDRDLFEGHILVESSGFFEGIVKNNTTNEETIILGIYYPGKFIKMYKINERVCKKPIRLETQREDCYYEGNFYQIDLFGETPCGNCKIEISGRPLEDENNMDALFFQKKMNYFMSVKLDALARDFYIRKKRELISISLEELSMLNGTVNIINKNLMDEKTYYKLTRKIINLFQPDDFK